MAASGMDPPPVLDSLRRIGRGELDDLVTAALLVATIDDGWVDAPWVRQRLTDLTLGFRPAADAILDLHASSPDAAATANALAEALCTHLHDDTGLTGEVGDYYNPGNSRIDEVLRSGTGIPVSLAVIYCTVGRGCGVQIDPVNFPAHLLLRVLVDEDAVLIDPFAGVLLGLDECQQRLDAIHAKPTPLAQHHLQPLGTAQMVLRMLNNLKAIRLGRDELDRALEVSDLIMVLAPEHGPELQQRAELLERLGSTDAALVAWQQLLPKVRDAETRHLIEARIARLRQS